MGVTKDRVVNIHSLIEVLYRFVKHAEPGNPSSKDEAEHALLIMKAMFSDHPPNQYQCDPPETYPDIPPEQ